MCGQKNLSLYVELMAWLIGIFFVGGGLGLMVFRRDIKNAVNSELNPLVKVQLALVLFGSPLTFLLGIFILYQKFLFVFDQKDKFVDWCLADRGIVNYEIVSVEKGFLAPNATVRLYDLDAKQTNTCYPWTDEID